MLIKELYLKKFKLLIKQADRLLENASGDDSCFKTINRETFIGFKTKVVDLLDCVIPRSAEARTEIAAISKMNNVEGNVRNIRARLKAYHDDFKDEMFASLESKVSAEITVDYLSMSEDLLKDKTNKKYSYIAAAVLAGGALENSLRALCGRQSPAIPIMNGAKKKTLSSLIDDLKKANVFNEIKAKKLRAYADVRNAAAHGRYTDFSEADVKQMVTGIIDFLAEVA